MISKEEKAAQLADAMDKEERFGSLSYWACFHCDAVFYDRYEASLHFGHTQSAKAACIDTDMLKTLRQAELDRDEFRARALRAEEEVDSVNGEIAEFKRITGGDGNVNTLRMKLDSLEGCRITLEAYRTRYATPLD